jgi:hypothetical protein
VPDRCSTLLSSRAGCVATHAWSGPRRSGGCRGAAGVLERQARALPRDAAGAGRGRLPRPPDLTVHEHARPRPARARGGRHPLRRAARRHAGPGDARGPPPAGGCRCPSPASRRAGRGSTSPPPTP